MVVRKFNYLKQTMLILVVLITSVKAEESIRLDLNKIAESFGLQAYDSLKSLLGQISFDGWLPQLATKKVGKIGARDLFSSVGTATILGQKIDIYLTTTKDPNILGITTIKGQQKALEKAASNGDIVSVALSIPKSFKLGTISTYLSYLDELGLGGAVFVLSREKYQDSKFGEIDVGLNLVGNINFSSGALSMINGWAKRMLNLSLDKGIYVHTVIPHNLKDITLSISIPGSVTYIIKGTASGELPIEVFDINLQINNKGLIGSAFIKPITLAGVTVSGSEGHPGIMMNFTFDLWNIYELSRLLLTFNTQDLAKLTKLTIRGNISLKAPNIGIISGPAIIDLSKEGITADFEASIIKGFLDAKIRAKTDITHLDNWKISGNFNQTALKAFDNLMTKKAKEFLKIATKGINDAKSEVQAAQRKIDGLAEDRRKIERENLENIKKAQEPVQREIDKLNDLKQRLDNAKRRCEEMGKAIKETGKVIGKGIDTTIGAVGDMFGVGSGSKRINMLLDTIRTQDINFLERLLKDPKLDVNSPIWVEPNTGINPLMMAILTNNPIIVKDLLDTKANPEITDKAGKTALMLAVENNAAIEIISTLLNAKANPNIKDKSGKTALMLAVEKNSSIEIVKFLIDHGARTDMGDKNGKTALDFARSRSTNDDNSKAILLLLESKNQQQMSDEAATKAQYEQFKKKWLQKQSV